jgi:hypothetical protein
MGVFTTGSLFPFPIRYHLTLCNSCLFAFIRGQNCYWMVGTDALRRPSSAVTCRRFSSNQTAGL